MMNYICVSGMLLIAALGIMALISQDDESLMATMLLEIGLLSLYALFLK